MISNSILSSSIHNITRNNIRIMEEMVVVASEATTKAAAGGQCAICNGNGIEGTTTILLTSVVAFNYRAREYFEIPH